MRHLTLFTWILLLGIPLQAEESEFPKEESTKILTSIQTQLKTLFEKSKLDVAISVEDQTLTARYKTREFMVHIPLMTGQYQDAFKEEGPDFKGLLVTLRVGKGRREERQIVLPQTSKQPYWLVYLDMLPLKNGFCLDVNIKYSPDFDVKLVEEIKHIAAEVTSPK